MNTNPMITFGMANNVALPIKPTSPFSSMEEWKKERDDLLMLTGQVGKRFNQFVRNTVRYFYFGGDHNVVLVNGLLLIAHQSKMANKQRLAAYLADCIPHKLHKGGQKDEAPRFGKREGEYDWPAVDLFLRNNLEWNQYGKEPDPKQFQVSKYMDNVLKVLHKEKVNVKTFIADMMMKEAEHTAKQAAKRAAGASR